jgi:polysaccharide export outer membrane protein
VREVVPRVVLGLLLALAACNDVPPARYPEAAPEQATEANLASGDTIDVQVFWGNHEAKTTYHLGPTGTIMVQHIGEVKADGKKPSELQAEIRDRLADGYLRDPIVALTVMQSTSRRISVFGQVQSASTIPFTEAMTIVDAIAQAGGFTAMAKKNAVQVTRVVGGKKVTYTIGVEAIGEGRRPNFAMEAGDVIFVPERLF